MCPRCDQVSVNPKDVGIATSGSTFFRSVGIWERIADFRHHECDVHIAALPDTIRPIVLESFTSSLSTAFLAAVPILIVAFV